MVTLYNSAMFGKTHIHNQEAFILDLNKKQSRVFRTLNISGERSSKRVKKLGLFASSLQMLGSDQCRHQCKSAVDSHTALDKMEHVDHEKNSR